MPQSAPSRCTDPGPPKCPNLAVDRGRCTDHRRPAWENKSAGWATGGSRAWRKRRADHLLNNPLCVVCGAVAEEADHVTELADGGDLLRGDLQSFCTFHHREKSRASSKARAIHRARAARGDLAAAVAAAGGIPGA